MVTSQFVSLAKVASKSRGYPDLPEVVVPHPFESLPEADVLRIADEKLEEIVQNLTVGAEKG